MNAQAEYALMICDRLSFRAVAEAYGFAFGYTGFTRCPFHADDTPSFHVVPGRNAGKCFGCGWVGDIISFTAKLFDISRLDAMRKLNDDFRLNLPIGRKATVRERTTLRRAYAEKVAAERARIAQNEAAESEYWRLVREWVRLDKKLRDGAPKSFSDDLSADFVKTLREITQIDARLDRVEAERWERICQKQI